MERKDDKINRREGQFIVKPTTTTKTKTRKESLLFGVNGRSINQSIIAQQNNATRAITEYWHEVRCGHTNFRNIKMKSNQQRPPPIAPSCDGECSCLSKNKNQYMEVACQHSKKTQKDNFFTSFQKRNLHFLKLTQCWHFVFVSFALPPQARADSKSLLSKQSVADISNKYHHTQEGFFARQTPKTNPEKPGLK